MYEELLIQTSTALRKAALNEKMKEFVLTNPALFNTLKKAANRYIGGETLLETIDKVKIQNANGFKCSMEFMGESTKTEHATNEARNEFVRICQTIRSQNLHSTVSLDLSHIGLSLSKEVCLENLSLICQEASLGNTEVIISAEGPERTDAVLSTYQQITKAYPNVGITLQAYLYRTKDDFSDIIKLPGRIRIVKGAFDTPSGLSLPRGEQLDQVYLEYVDQLLQSNHLCSIATHDKIIQQATKAIIKKHNTPTGSYEFESLYGIQNKQLSELKEQGYPTKIYFVYGKEWYLYLCNRLAEYPMNVFQALNDIIE